MAKPIKNPIKKSVVSKPSDFEFFMRDVNILSFHIPFEHIYVLCREDMHSLIQDIYFENVEFIYYNIKSLEIDIPDLVLRMFKQNSVCLFILDINYFLKVDFAMVACVKNHCEFPVYAKTLDINDQMISVGQSKMMSAVVPKIMNMITCISKLSVRLPVLALPLIPTLICSAKYMLDHSFIHHSSTVNFYFASENSNWKVFDESLTGFWNNTLENINDKYFKSEILKSYIGNLEILTFEDTSVDKLVTVQQNTLMWRYIFKAFIDILRFGSVAGSNTPVLVRKIDKLNVSSFPEETSNCDLPFIKDKAEFSNVLDGAQKSANEEENLIDETSSKNINVLLILWNHSTQDEGTITDTFNCISTQTSIHKYEDHLQIEVPTDSIIHIDGILNELVGENPQIKSCVLRDIEFALMKFKTIKCKGFCSGGPVGKCFYYHSMADKRRIPLSRFNTYNYNAILCSYPVSQSGVCTRGENSCTFSHNKYELFFHPSVYKTEICPCKEIELCKFQPYCLHAHKNTPEMFYNKEWEDLVVFGLDNSLKFTIGAITGFPKPSTLGNKKIVFISTSDKMLNIMEAVILKVFGQNSIRTVILGKNSFDPDHIDVFLGMPFTLINSYWYLLCRTDIKAFIVDDTLKMFENAFVKQLLVAAVNMIREKNDVSKVFVCEVYNSETARFISASLGIPLKEVNPKAIEVGTRQTQQEFPTTEAFISSCHLESKDNNAIISTNVLHDEDSSTSENSGVKRYLSISESPFNSFTEDQNKNIHFKLERISRSPPFSREITLKQEFRESSSESCKSAAYHSSKKSSQSSRKRSRSRSSSRTKSKRRKRSREKDEKVNKYKKYVSGSSEDKKKKSDHDKNEEEKLYYRKITSHSKALSYVPESKGHSSSHTSSSSSSSSQNVVSLDKFSLSGVLKLLVALENKLGTLGSAVISLVKSAKDNEGSATIGWSLFLDKENVSLLNMIIDKLRRVLVTSPSHEIPLLSKAIDWVQKLIEEAKMKAELKIDGEGTTAHEATIDLNAIAVASLNKGSAYILDLIKTAFACDDKLNPTKEEINLAYLKVCYLHCELALGNGS